jgi:hypothetical protein
MRSNALHPMTRTILDLGQQPLVNNLCDSELSSMAAATFPLKAIIEDDLTIHLDYAVDPSVLYGNYLYRSSTSKPYIEHCEALFQSFSHLRHDTIIDIGGNDGALLKAFKRRASKKLALINVDASPTFKKDNEEAGIKFVNDFWGDHLDIPKANIITSTNVFQHTKDIHAFMRGIQKFLDGVWILEFPYTLDTIITGQFDQFYHEHYYYWLMAPLEKLFKQYGLRIIHTQSQSIHGGTMRMWMTNKEIGAPTIDLSKAKALEAEAIEKCNFEQTIDKLKNYFNYVLSTSELGRICFFGAAAKGCVFLNTLGLNVETMGKSVVIDDTVEKQGLYVPGTGFQVVDRSALKDYDTVIILAHNFATYIDASLRQEFNGRIITLLPIETDK